ncbi:hypothetical protein PI124_g8853 [Phytophthora idaei]|nr:hypothetical protein PI125_g8462 [Phytophthora idaei]KAG3163453.1 hypothetical protein PI126_g5552 [Phytophthora idaei]KAG3246443.1 hypothetical protein PI124_g8853 [Phytophthora idaei]
MDTCKNVYSAVYCTPETCKLEAICSNAPRTGDTLKVFNTWRVGFEVFTTTDLDAGDIVGEYTGVLCEYDALIDGQPDPLKHRSGYTMLYNRMSIRKKYVYVEALNHGYTTRFINHACGPNSAFVEMQKRANVKVLVKMIKDVKAGAQITVNYGPERWFKCAWDLCWNVSGGAEDESRK